MMTSKEIESLRRWFHETRRPLPWRDAPTPYQVWVSEVMLQQTQVSVVIPYYERWMTRFPTVAALAAAPIETVIKAWEGLGYYSRARNLHAGAQYVVEHHNGVLPSTSEALKRIKGLGDYTVGAIRAFAFHEKAAAIDGNVLRVMSRYDAVEDDITRTTTRKAIAARVEAMLPQNAPWEVTEALIELGATVCTKAPRCDTCPLRRQCAARRDGTQERYPIKRKGPGITPLYRAVAVLKSDDKYLSQKGKEGKVMADLYQFPYWETDANGWSEPQLSSALQRQYGVGGTLRAQLPTVEHGFTRYRVTLSPFIFEVDSPFSGHGRWTTLEEMRELPFSSGHRRILHHIGDHL